MLHCPKDNFLTCGYMRRYFYLPMVFLCPEFSRLLCNTPVQSLGHILKLSKKFIDLLSFHSVKYFDKSQEIRLFDNVQRQAPRYVRRKIFFAKIVPNLQERPVLKSSFSKLESCSLFMVHLWTTASERIVIKKNYSC